MDGRTNGMVGGWTDELIKNGQRDGWMDGRMEGRMVIRTVDEWTDQPNDVQKKNFASKYGGCKSLDIKSKQYLLIAKIIN